MIHPSAKIHPTALVADGVKAGEPCRRAVQSCGSSVANIRLPYGKSRS